MLLDLLNRSVAHFNRKVEESDGRWIEVIAPGRIIAGWNFDDCSQNMAAGTLATQDVPRFLDFVRIREPEDESFRIRRVVELKIRFLRR